MSASTTILEEKLHEYPQQDVIDGSGGGSAAVLDDCLNQNGGVLHFCTVMPAEHFVPPENGFASMKSPTIRITWPVQGSMNSGCAALLLS